MIIHGGLIALYRRGAWRGVLLLGPSGSGKSDLALRAEANGFTLVADDRVDLFVSAGLLFGRAPIALRGLLEVRGLAIVPLRVIDLCEIVLVAKCVASGGMDRLPDPQEHPVCGVMLPMIRIAPLEASAPAKLCHAVEVLGRGAQPAYDAAFPRLTPRDST